MSGKIEVGSIVRCVNAKTGQSIVNGWFYTVKEVMKGRFVRLSGEGLPPSHSYAIERFELCPQAHTKIAEVL